MDVQTSDDAQPKFSGTLSFLDNAVDRNTGTITARATITNPDHTLLPGEFVHVHVHIADQPDALLVPQVALGSSQLGRFVYIVGKDDKAEQHIVSAGASYGSLIVIDKGVNEGDRIIVGNLQKIAAGAPVQPVPAKSNGVWGGWSRGMRSGGVSLSSASAQSLPADILLSLASPSGFPPITAGGEK